MNIHPIGILGVSVAIFRHTSPELTKKIVSTVKECGENILKKARTHDKTKEVFLQFNKSIKKWHLEYFPTSMWLN